VRVSIVVPVLNAAADLARLLDALVPQLRLDELIVVNDGSTNPAVRELLASRPLITAVHHKLTRGSAAARNSGIERATCERVLFIDADCLPDPGWVDAHRQFHAQWPDEVCVGDIHAASTRSVLLRYLEWGSLPMFGFHDLQPQHGEILTHHFFYTANASVPRAALQASGAFDERYNAAWDDIELGMRLAAAGNRFRFNQHSVVSHRHPETLVRFWRRQVRVGRGYWRYHRAHPNVVPALTARNQCLSLVSGLRTASARSAGVGEAVGFLALDVTGRCCFWAGYIAEQRDTAGVTEV
jgi:GT2 family glycosyltransferase